MNRHHIAAHATHTSPTKSYHAKQDRLVAQLHAINEKGAPVAISKRSSNLFRARHVNKKQKLNFKNLNQVIAIDKELAIAEVEAATTYKDLVDVTLAHSLMPAIVPQFTTITVGGAVSGGACEASSFKFGTVHETVTEMTVLLGNGQVVTATPNNEYSDLFFALPNTFGSLGYILKLKIKLVPVKKFVRIQHLHFTNADAYFTTITKIMNTQKHEGTPVNFIDGMVRSYNDLHLTLGQFIDSVPYTSNYTYMNIYYKSIPKRDEDYLTIRDFIWRWETDWVWGSKAFGMQNKALRLLIGKIMLNSTAYWKLVNLDRRYKLADKAKKLRHNRTPKEIMVQDVETPIEQSKAFLNYFLDNFDLRPIWVCPMQSHPKYTFTFSGLKSNMQYINYGLWGSVTSDPGHSKNHFNRLLETSMKRFKGSKALYSTNFYSEKEFWKLFNESAYNILKAKYDPAARLKSFYHKVCERVS